MPDPGQTVFVAGAGLRGSGYPNAWNTIRILRAIGNVHVVECGKWLPESFRLWQLSRGPKLAAALQISMLLASNGFSVIRLLFRSRRKSVVYIPYPSLFMLWLLSWLPSIWRPRCICDAYITVWDSLYQDRLLGNAAGRMARVLLALESRALRAAEVVLVDTTANAEHVSRLFGVPRKQVRAFPLALDSSLSSAVCKEGSRQGVVRVLFIGTFVPLQGTTVIAQAIDALRGHEHLEFVLIGDGQLADEAARWLDGHPAVTWMRGWQSPRVLAEHLAGADICLGVFGGDGKAARVLPFKLYMALAAGKAIITQAAYSTPGTPSIPALTVVPTADALQAAILDLARNPDRRKQLERDALDYYREHLDDAAIYRAWSHLIPPGLNQSTGQRRAANPLG